MPGQLVRQLKPEEEEILRKREELALIRASLAELELELVDFRSRLAIFEGRYLRQVGVLYAELDDWKARLSELRARLDPSSITHAQAEKDRAQARQTYEDAHSESSQAPDFTPNPDLKGLFRELAKCIHPDLAQDTDDRERRTRLMADANSAYKAGDAETLRRILKDSHDSQRELGGEGVGAELIRLIRLISSARARLVAIEQELVALGESEIAKLKEEAEEIQLAGGDLLDQLAASVREQLERIKKEYELLARN